MGDERGNLVVIELNKPGMVIYIPAMLWKDMYDFSKDAVLLVLPSEHYDNSEYIRDYEEYKKHITQAGTLIHNK